MPNFDRFDVVAVPFPYTDRPVLQRRPAVVVSAPSLTATHGLVWVMMITAAENRRWPDDVMIGDLEKAGLPIPSVVRPAKLATVEARHIEKRGRLDAVAVKAVAAALVRYMPPQGKPR